MTDIEALRTRMRCDVTGNLVGTDTRMIGAPPCGCQGCRADAEITRLREDLDRVTRERDEARNGALNLLAVIHRDGGHHTQGVGLRQSVEDAHTVWAALMTRAEAAEAALAKRDEEVARLTAEIEARRDGSTADTIIANWFDLGRELGLPAGASVWEAVMKMRETLRTVDGHYDMLGYAKDSIARTTVREVLPKEPTNAE